MVGARKEGGGGTSRVLTASGHVSPGACWVGGGGRCMETYIYLEWQGYTGRSKYQQGIFSNLGGDGGGGGG